MKLDVIYGRLLDTFQEYSDFQIILSSLNQIAQHLIPLKKIFNCEHFLKTN